MGRHKGKGKNKINSVSPAVNGDDNEDTGQSQTQPSEQSADDS
ncbi:MAG: hypothetical protein ACJ76S_09535 [Solirubrobacteraceae bacterium]|jgi:hypothetical protein